MSRELFNSEGQRLYLDADERARFLLAAKAFEPQVQSLCHTLHYTGCRISEALNLTAERLNVSGRTIVFETLKKRQSAVYRDVPVPAELIDMLDQVHGIRHRRIEARDFRLWPWSRTKAWMRVKAVMQAAEIEGPQATPKGLRHGYGVWAIQNIPINLLQQALGHAQLSTTAIYANAMGKEKREIFSRMWRTI